MKFSTLALGTATGLVLSAWSASAALYTYQFGGNGIVCYALSAADTPKCSTPNTFYTNPTLAAPIPSQFPSVEAFGDQVDNDPTTLSSNEVNHFQPGLGVAAKGSPADPWVGVQEDLILRFSEAVNVVGFELSGRVDGSGTAQFGVVGDSSPDTFAYANNFYGDANEVPQSFDLSASPVTGDSFIFSNAQSGAQVPKTGFAVYSVTIDFEPENEPGIVPVPPAAPLLGGALALLAWRARRSKRS